MIQPIAWSFGFLAPGIRGAGVGTVQNHEKGKKIDASASYCAGYQGEKSKS